MSLTPTIRFEMTPAGEDDDWPDPIGTQWTGDELERRLSHLGAGEALVVMQRAETTFDLGAYSSAIKQAHDAGHDVVIRIVTE